MSVLPHVALALSIGLLPLVCLLRGFAGAHSQRWNPAHLVAYAFGAYLAAPLLVGGSTGDADRVGATPLGRVGWLVIVGISASGLLLSNATRSKRRSAGRAIRILLIALIASQFLSSLYASRPLAVNVLVPSLAVALVLTEFPSRDFNTAIVVARRAVLIPVCASLLAFVGGLTWAMSEGLRRSPNPFTSQRLTGTLPDPNALGHIAAISVVLALSSRSRWWPIQFGVSGLVLWLSDARTMILITAVALLALALQALQPGPRTRALMAMTAATFLVFAAASVWNEQGISANRDLSTLNGRTELWTFGLAFWRTNPVLGAGPGAFDEAFRISTGLDYAGQAHNQFIQSLAANGLIGLFLVSALVVAIARRSWAIRVPTNGTSLALGLVYAAILAVESPLRSVRPAPGLFATMLVLLVLLSDGGTEERKETTRRSNECIPESVSS